MGKRRFVEEWSDILEFIGAHPGCFILLLTENGTEQSGFREEFPPGARFNPGTQTIYMPCGAKISLFRTRDHFMIRGVRADAYFIWSGKVEETLKCIENLELSVCRQDVLSKEFEEIKNKVLDRLLSSPMMYSQRETILQAIEIRQNQEVTLKLIELILSYDKRQEELMRDLETWLNRSRVMIIETKEAL